MTICFTPSDYQSNRDQIRPVIAGEMCKIAEETHTVTGEKRHIISTDVLKGWPSAQDASAVKFHGPLGTVDSWARTGLGTFYLIDMKQQDDGTYALRFTDDLNPDLP